MHKSLESFTIVQNNAWLSKSISWHEISQGINTLPTEVYTALSAEDVVRQGQDYSSLPGFHEMNLLRAGPVEVKCSLILIVKRL